jgi:hypothetical protein
MAMKIKEDYLTYMEKKIAYFESLSVKLFNRKISQVLLLHNNKLNSDHIESLISIYKLHNYRIVSLKKVLKDPAYKTPITVYKNWAISWLERWAITRKSPREYFNGDPETPEYIITYIRE